MQAIFGSAFGAAPVNVDIYPSGVADRKFREIAAGATGTPQRCYIYSSGEDIAGDVKVGVGGGRRLDHLGIKIELKGVIGEEEGDGGAAAWSLLVGGGTTPLGELGAVVRAGQHSRSPPRRPRRHTRRGSRRRLQRGPDYVTPLLLRSLPRAPRGLNW